MPSFDTKFLWREGVQIKQEFVHDTMVMAHLLDPRKSINLENQASRHVDKRARVGKNALSAAFKDGGWSFDTIPVDHPSYWMYSALDAVLTASLAEVFWPKIQPYTRVYETEMACVHVLREAGRTGVKIDMDYVRLKRAELQSEIERLRGVLPVSPSKDRDVVNHLIHLGAVLTQTTKSGALSVEDDVLATFEDAYPDFIAPLRRCRKAMKVVSSYLDNFVEMNVDDILYPSVKVVGARTGRMSVTEPALQTLPRGREVRDAFIAREGCTLILADYQQAELRVLASYAQEEAMIEAFADFDAGRGVDLHTWVAKEAYRTDEPSKKQRAVAKNVQFARLYGAGAPKIAATAKVPLADIEDFLIRYNELFPGVSEFMERTTEEVMSTEFEGERKTGYIHTILGRRIPVEKQKAYSGVNYRIQSSATADLLKLKLVELDAAGLGPYIRLPVHDEIVFEIPDEHVDEAISTIRDVMPERNLFNCPIEIDVETTKRWGDKYAEFD